MTLHGVNDGVTCPDKRCQWIKEDKRCQEDKNAATKSTVFFLVAKILDNIAQGVKKPTMFPTGGLAGISFVAGVTICAP